MRFFKKIAGYLGFGSHNDAHENNDEDESDNNNYNNRSDSDDIRRDRMNVDPIPAGPRRGFSVPVQVPVERNVVGPILVPCNGDGGIQGLRWYASRLKTDEDGDIADEFLNEIVPDKPSTSQDQARTFPKFEVKNNARPAKIKSQALTDGKLQHYVERQGQLQWV